MDWTRPTVAAAFTVVVTAAAPQLGRAVGTLLFLPAVFGVVYSIRYWYHFVHNIERGEWELDEYRLALTMMEQPALVALTSGIDDTPREVFDGMVGETGRWTGIALAAHLGASLVAPSSQTLPVSLNAPVVLTSVVLPPVVFLGLGALCGIFVTCLDALQLWRVGSRARDLRAFTPDKTE